MPQLVQDEPAVLERGAERLEREREVVAVAATVARQLSGAPVAHGQGLAVAHRSGGSPDDVRALGEVLAASVGGCAEGGRGCGGHGAPLVWHEVEPYDVRRQRLRIFLDAGPDADGGVRSFDVSGIAELVVAADSSFEPPALPPASERAAPVEVVLEVPDSSAAEHRLVDGWEGRVVGRPGTAGCGWPDFRRSEAHDGGPPSVSAGQGVVSPPETQIL